MIDTKDIPIQEPQKGIRFNSLYGVEGLYKHVKKHLFNREERWSQLFDSDLIAEAKKDCFSEIISKKTAYHKLALEYQSLVSDILYSLCNNGVGHLHIYTEERLTNRAYQKVDAWDLSAKIQIVAKSFVRNGNFSPYVLCTAFRPFPKLSGKQVRKKVLERWQEDTNSFYSNIILARHDVDPVK
ncbi:MAG: hypothetical protein LBE12_08595 [Planctomycetaceae bacterium]|jgi:hypothetical protein|nr:hypothetical protein [Planctomycetaceae bacterium]